MAKITPQSILDTLVSQINDNMSNYEDDSIEYITYQSVLVMIQAQQEELDTEKEKKRLRDEKTFDELHNSYQAILKDGHIGVPNEFHQFCSDLSTDKISITLFFDYLSDDLKVMIVDGLFTSDFNEQMVAHRYDFHYITKKHGHDGIDEDDNVYEAKNKAYSSTSKSAIGPDIQFSGVSHNIHKKLTEGRPLIIANITDGHKLLFECLIDTSDALLRRYKMTADNKTAGVTYRFSEYKDYIKDITFVREDFEAYDNLDKKFLRELKELTTKNSYTVGNTVIDGDY